MQKMRYQTKPVEAGETKPVVPEAAKPIVPEAPKPVELADECPLCHQHETVTVHTKDGDGNKLKNIRCQKTGCLYIARFKNGKMV
jgi:hypothetical protein